MYAIRSYYGLRDPRLFGNAFCCMADGIRPALDSPGRGIGSTFDASHCSFHRVFNTAAGSLGAFHDTPFDLFHAP